MKKSTPMFPGFHLQTLRRKPRSPQQQLAEKLDQLRQKSFKQIGEVFEKFIPKTLLRPEKEGVMSRRRHPSSSLEMLQKENGQSNRTGLFCQYVESDDLISKWHFLNRR